MDLSILIVNYRSWDHLTECLDSLASFTRTRFTFEVIITDNRSDDGVLLEYQKKYPGFVFIQNSVNGGFANGCNLGAASAKGDFFLFLNPDTIAGENEVTTLFERAKGDPDTYITSCHQIDKNGKPAKAYGTFPSFGTLTGSGRAISKFLGLKNGEQSSWIKGNLITPDWVSGSVIMIKADVFRKLKGFDEDFWMYFEDMDLCKRAKDAGGGISYFTDILIQHHHGGSSRRNPRMTSMTKTEVIISNHVYLAKHNRGLTRVLKLLTIIVFNFFSGLIMAVIGLILFPVSKLFVRTHIFIRLIRYYIGAIRHGTWKSPLSVNFQKNV
jgi:GT2 family glycosyltransferase